MKLLLLSLTIVASLAGCAASVYHPTNSPQQMQADVNLCTRTANERYWMDPVAALYNAYDCLEDKGYRRDGTDLAATVEKALGEERKRGLRRGAICKVPC